MKLRAVQQPLKDAYRQNPQEAVVTLRARGHLGGQAITCSVVTGKALAEAGMHPATGGDGSLACSGDMLLAGAGSVRGRNAAGRGCVAADPGRRGDRQRRG